ncbi:nuclear transport factor 2 family protein [Christiangramia sabulilitoris]|uniref:Nuclear transport factor 2 family protein n=1 Tax=Christiangramia sabulilitoris TaxID=2583991 RepID=A0A550I698_9FLAO|nr:nuclear transport factor 2 family protein [Christiangramia sabulilitoris]TRO66502.1 nuclear transport factor 2 family protein [Christiangramia sabulilitoris]
MKDREELLKKLNEAFASCNTDFLTASVTDDVSWQIVGEKTISGKKNFEKSLDRMRLGGPVEIKVSQIIISDEKSVVEGIVEFQVEPGKKKKYAFCDIYVFAENDEQKFKELRTYVAHLKKKK